LRLATLVGSALAAREGAEPGRKGAEPARKGAEPGRKGAEPARNGNAEPPPGEPVLVDVAEPRADAVEVIRAAGTLIVATPTYKGAYTGVLKVLFDELPARGLAGIAAVPVITAGIRSQAEATERHLHDLLVELAADPVAPALLVTDAELGDGDPASLAALVQKYVVAL
jgi:FMN reductase